jgi:hypothetical protein
MLKLDLLNVRSKTQHKQTRGHDWLTLIEALLVLTLLLEYIWFLRGSRDWLMVLGVVILSHVVRKEGPYEIGFWPRDIKKCFVEMFDSDWTVFILATMIVIVCASPWRPMTASHALGNLMNDLKSGLIQQYLLCGYFVNRLLIFYRVEINFNDKNKQISKLAGLFFSVVHFPNPFLMLIALIGGYFSSRIFLKYRNLYFLVPAFAVIKFLLFLIVPDNISHHFIVGPSYFR